MSILPIPCIYIPRVSAFVDENTIKEEFYEVGSISRVDFIPLGKKPGFDENIAGKFKSAFVHFRSFYEHGIIDEINTNGSFKFYTSNLHGEYWFLIKAVNPIQDTMMNNAQIVENCRVLEKKVEEQSATIKAMEEKLNGLHSLVHQFVGGLFHGEKQTAIQETYLSVLFPDIKFDQKPVDADTIWPTTMQGYENEKRIEALEKGLQEAIYVINDHAEKGTKLSSKFYNNYPCEVFASDEDAETQDGALQYRKQQKKMEMNNTDADSSHSSMPELIDDNSVSSSSNSSSNIPDLESISSKGSSSKRLRNSCDLCGNQ